MEIQSIQQLAIALLAGEISQDDIVEHYGVNTLLAVADMLQSEPLQASLGG